MGVKNCVGEEVKAEGKIAKRSWGRKRESVAVRESAIVMTKTMAKKRILIPIVNGSGEIETTCIAGTLNHFGAEVVMASVMQMDDHQCDMHRGLNFLADVNILAPFSEPWDLITFTGGPGAEKIPDSTRLISMLKGQKEK